MILNQKLTIIRLFPKSNLETYKSLYYGYPLEILIKLWELVDVKREDLKIAVVDDFGLEAVNFLLDKGIQLDNLTMIVSDEKSFEKKKREFEKLINVRTINLINFFEKEKGYYIDNNMFDLIIANPPYGKSSSLSRKIINTLLESKVAKEYVVLAPFNTYTNVYENISDFKFLGATNQYFTDASLHGLSLTKLLNKKTEKFKTWEDVLCSTVSKDLVQLKDAVVQYNKTHKAFYKTLHNWIGRNAESIKKVCNERNSFLITLWQPQDKVHVDESAMDIQHNLKDKPITWGKDDGGLIEFETRKEFENFRDWFYKKPGHSKEAQSTFIYKALAFLDQAYNGGTTVLKYNSILPNLDWSHPWTDKEILKEIGLPEDFLEEK